MKTIGQIIKNARIENKYSLEDLEKITKIKSSFIDALEKEKWEKLPSFATVLGFVKSISDTLGINQRATIAVLKRDYLPGKISISPKPDISTKRLWGPKFTFFLGIGIILIAVLGYLVYQYINFVSPPNLEVLSPIENQIVSGRSVAVFGSTDTDAKIIVNNEPVLVNQDGKFSINVNVSQDTQDVIVIAQSRSGKTTTVSRKIEVQNN